MKYIFLLLISIVNVFALDAFIKPNELKTSFQDKNLIILDVDNEEYYNKSHITNAIFVDVNRFINKDSSYLAMKSASDIENELSKLGIKSNSQVIIYSHNTQKGLLNSSYMALVLISHGFENVSILDGGYMAWVFENEFLTSSKDSTKKEETIFKAKKTNIRVNTTYVKNSLGKVVMLDSRDTPYYYGTKRSKNIASIGHIPFAKSSYFNDKFLRDSTIRDIKELNEIFIDGYELKKDDKVIVYSDNIFSASINWYILYKHLGFSNAKIYENSLLEWGNSSDLSTIRFKWE